MNADCFTIMHTTRVYYTLVWLKNLKFKRTTERSFFFCLHFCFDWKISFENWICLCARQIHARLRCVGLGFVLHIAFPFLLSLFNPLPVFFLFFFVCSVFPSSKSIINKFEFASLPFVTFYSLFLKMTPNINIDRRKKNISHLVASSVLGRFSPCSVCLFFDNTKKWVWSDL